MQVIQLFGGDRSAEATVPDDFKRQFEGLPVDEWDSFWAHGWAGTMGTGKDDYQAAPHGQNYFPCNWLWKSMAIYWDGTVPACCADFTSEQIVGNLNENSLMDVWNGPEFQAIRSAQVAGGWTIIRFAATATPYGRKTVRRGAGSAWQGRWLRSRRCLSYRSRRPPPATEAEHLAAALNAGPPTTDGCGQPLTRCRPPVIVPSRAVNAIVAFLI